MCNEEKKDFCEYGKFIRANVASLFSAQYRKSMQPNSNKLVRIVPNRSGVYPIRTFIKSSLIPYKQLPTQPAKHFIGHRIRNQDGIEMRLDQVLQIKKLLMFIFCSNNSVNKYFLDTLRTFYQGLENLPPTIELILCPLDGCSAAAEEHFKKHANYFTFDATSQFIWQLRFMYKITSLKPCAIVVRRNGELVTRYPFLDINRHKINAVNNWLI